jgi:hypothetical protein
LSSCSLCGGACAKTKVGSSGVAWTDPNTTADSMVPIRKRFSIGFRFGLVETLAIFFILLPRIAKVGSMSRLLTAQPMLGSMALAGIEPCRRF